MRGYGQAVRRDHRDPDHHNSVRVVGPPVLHLDARCSQGPRRYGAQDREIRILTRRLVDVRRTRSSASSTVAPPGMEMMPLIECEIIERLATASSVASCSRMSSIVHRRSAGAVERGDQRGSRQDHRQRWNRPREDPLGARLRDPPRHLLAVLRLISHVATWSNREASASSPPVDRERVPADDAYVQSVASVRFVPSRARSRPATEVSSSSTRSSWSRRRTTGSS